MGFGTYREKDKFTKPFLPPFHHPKYEGHTDVFGGTLYQLNETIHMKATSQTINAQERTIFDDLT